jgi:sporulation protein YlmC with PRC-barrel domain
MTETSAHVSEAYGWWGRTIIGSRRERIGEIQDVYIDECTGRIDWALVETGRFVRRTSFVPLAGARAEGEQLRVRHTREQVRDAPGTEGDALSAEEEAELWAHYGMRYDIPARIDDVVRPRLRRSGGAPSRPSAFLPERPGANRNHLR